MYIYTDGSLPLTDRSDQAPALAPVIFIADCDGEYTLLGYLASQLRHSGRLFPIDFDVDSILVDICPASIVDSTLVDLQALYMPGYRLQSLPQVAPHIFWLILSLPSTF